LWGSSSSGPPAQKTFHIGIDLFRAVLSNRADGNQKSNQARKENRGQAEDGGLQDQGLLTAFRRTKSSWRTL
jgi:hypothetical protein